MSNMEHWRLAITPLSPVHVGSSYDYSPTGYVIEDGALYEFDGLAALAALPDAERQRLNGILNARPSATMLRAVQSFFHGNRERLIPVARQHVRVNPTVEAFYQERVGQVAQHESNGATVQNRLEIERTAWSSGTGTAIVPGSGLKGAIRTALLDEVNAGRALPTDLKQDRHANRKLQERLFKGSFDTDPLRLLRISDASLLDPAGFATEVRFALNRKKRVMMRDGQAVQSKAEQQNLYQLLECLPAFAARAFEATLSLQDTGGVASKAWPSLRFSFSEIAAACNRFYRGHLEREIGVMRSMGYLDAQWAGRIDELFSGPVGQALDANQVFLLRVGRHSGAESVTVNGVRSIRIMKGKGNPPDFLDSAKTLWLASHDRQSQRDLLPFGWVLIEASQGSDGLCEWPESLRNHDIAPWRESVLRHSHVLRTALDAQQQREAEQHRAVEQAELAAREREARLAAMSEEERRIESLLATLAQERETGTLAPSSRVASERVELLRAALEWDSQTLRQQAADAIQETVRVLPWSKKSKADRQSELVRLRDSKA